MPNDAALSDEPRATTVSDLTERELIGRIQRQLAPAPDWLLVGIGDDAAVLEPERNRVEVLSVDCLVDGVHFDRAFVPAPAIGHRALAANLSDLAAMGASPRLALLSLALPAGLDLTEFDGLVTGIASLAARHRVHVVGGNLTRTPGPLTVDVTVAGSIKRRQALRRSGARPGDEVYVTGTVGAAAAGLQMLKAGVTASESETCRARYLYPEARLRMGTLLSRNRLASACMDLSDGLADALRQVAEASGVAMAVDLQAVPIEPAAREWFASRGADPIAAAAGGGDDYELLFTIRPKLRRRLEAIVRHAGVTVTRIGVCAAGSGVTPELPRGYGHFK